MIITQAILDDLTKQAQSSSRLRSYLDLRNTPEDLSQRLLIAIEPESICSIHRHQETSETLACLRGKFVIEFYDELERRCVESVVISPNGNAVAVDIPAGQWHTVHSLESGTIILESKDGKYEPTGPEDILTL